MPAPLTWGGADAGGLVAAGAATSNATSARRTTVTRIRRRFASTSLRRADESRDAGSLVQDSAERDRATSGFTYWSVTTWDHRGGARVDPVSATWTTPTPSPAETIARALQSRRFIYVA